MSARPISKEILLYCSSPYKKYRWMGYSNVIQVGFVAVNILLMPSEKLLKEHEAMKNEYMGRTKPSGPEKITEEIVREPVASLSLVQRVLSLDFKEILNPINVFQNIRDRPSFCIPLIGFSVVYTGLTYFYTRRLAHMITLLPTGHVKFSSFSPFALRPSPSIVIPVRDVSCVTPRQSETNYAIVKIRGYRGTHLIHKSEGQFLEPKLFDEYLGQTRSWAKGNWWQP